MRRIVDDYTGGVPVVVVADGEGHVGNVAGPEVPRVRGLLYGDAVASHLLSGRDVDHVIGSERVVEALQRRGLQYIRGVEQCSCSPYHVIRGNVQRNVVIVEVAVELLLVGEVHRIPAVVVIVNGDTGIEIRQIIGGRVNHAFATRFQRYLVVPVEGELHGVVVPLTANESMCTPDVRYASAAPPARGAPGLWMLTNSLMTRLFSVSGL